MPSKIPGYAFFFFAAVWIVTYFLMQRLPPLEDVRRELRQEPIQVATSAAPFQIDYKGQVTKVTPAVEYQLWGMVVSHNDPFVWYTFNIAHDESSLNTRDFCVIWGDNLWNADYRNVHVHNDDTFCITRWPAGTRGFINEKLSNNHLITNDEAIRKRINDVQIGDQIYLRGKLVNYSEDRWNGWVRRTSISREDTGNGACEVIFVEELQILSSHNRLWADMHHYSLYGMGGALALLVILFFFAPTKQERAIKEKNLHREAFFSSAESLRWEPLHPDAHQAGLWRRLVAAAIDMVIVTAGFLAWIVFAVYVLKGRLSELSSPEMAVNIIHAVPVIITALYFVILPATPWQGTIGKRMLGIIITDLHQQPIGVFRSLWRWLAFIFVSPLLAAVLAGGAGIAIIQLFSVAAASYPALLASCFAFFFVWPYLMAGVTRQKRALHDFLAGTLVMR